MNQKFIKDYEAFAKKRYSFFGSLFRRIKNFELRYLYYIRKKYESKTIFGFMYKIKLLKYRKKYGLEVDVKK